MVTGQAYREPPQFYLVVFGYCSSLPKTFLEYLSRCQTRSVQPPK
ncbi:MAG: hypothetical protein QHH09_02830 [Microgenomates group bacterium]|nr:hypothetical protein [Microgenomates group bacterium]